MKKIIDNLGHTIELSKEKNPVKNSFSINLSLKGANNYIFSNGKGSCFNSCLASAYGEFIERLQTNLYFHDFYLEDRKFFKDQKEFMLHEEFLSKELKQYYYNKEIEATDFLDFNSSQTDKIISLPFKNLQTKQEVYFPINLLANLYTSNGLSTGNTKNEAKVQALCEIFERYVKLKVIKETLVLPEFPQEVIEKFPKLLHDIKTLEEKGLKIKVYDASLDGVFPVTAIALINPTNHSLFLSFGSHPILEISLERTFTELLQGREIDELDSFERPTFDKQEISSTSNLESHFIDSNAKVGLHFLSSKKDFLYTPWKFHTQTSDKQFVFLTNILDSLDKTIYLREYNYLDFYSCQIIVPNFSEIYPFEDLIYNNKNQGKLIRDFILNQENYKQEDLLEVLSNFDDSLDVGSFIGVIFKKAFTLSEFKANILIKLKEYEEAIYYLEQTNNSFNYMLAQILRATNQKLDISHFTEAFSLLFSKQDIKRAFDILGGKQSLISLEYSPIYKEILNLFDSKYDRS